MPVTAQVDGIGNFEFPDGTSPDVVHAAVQKAVMAHNAPAPLSGPIGAAPVPEGLQHHTDISLTQPNDKQEANQAAISRGLPGLGKSVLGTIGDTGSLVNKLPVVGNVIAPKDEVNYYQQHAKANNSDEEAGKIFGNIAQMAIPTGEAAEALPSTSRAGEVFTSIAKDAAQSPVNLTRSADPLLELHDLGNAGSTLPKAVRQLVQRATSPDGAPILYPEARKFASKISGLSIAERMASDPNMRRVLGSLREGLNADVGDAAQAVGRGQDYEQAMKEYANASRLKKAAGVVGAGALGLGAKAAGLGAVAHVLGKVSGQ